MPVDKYKYLLREPTLMVWIMLTWISPVYFESAWSGVKSAMKLKLKKITKLYIVFSNLTIIWLYDKLR